MPAHDIIDNPPLPTLRWTSWNDKLIDEIVYRLYGLTEEEIRLVEGKK